MAFANFMVELAEARLGVRARPGDFPGFTPVPVPEWLRAILSRGMQLALVNEKARREFIVAPIYLGNLRNSPSNTAFRFTLGLS
jgi:hypothetical protein